MTDIAVRDAHLHRRDRCPRWARGDEGAYVRDWSLPHMRRWLEVAFAVCGDAELTRVAVQAAWSDRHGAACTRFAIRARLRRIWLWPRLGGLGRGPARQLADRARLRGRARRRGQLQLAIAATLPGDRRSVALAIPRTPSRSVDLPRAVRVNATRGRPQSPPAARAFAGPERPPGSTKTTDRASRCHPRRYAVEANRRGLKGGAAEGRPATWPESPGAVATFSLGRAALAAGALCVGRRRSRSVSTWSLLRPAIYRLAGSVEPTLGFEPRTCCLRNSCSTAELCRRDGKDSRCSKAGRSGGRGRAR